MDEKLSINNVVSGLDPSYTQKAVEPTKSNEEIGKDEFLQLLVTQLQNQDPLDPMKNEDFSVSLAQFSQLEQLVDINGKIGEEGAGTDMASMASYLGHAVVINSSEVQVKGGSGGVVSYDLEADAANVSLQLLDGAGEVRETIELGSQKAGKHTAEIQGAGLPSGSYNAQIVALSSSGTLMQPETLAAGVVSGFVPGPEPTLLVNGVEVNPADIREVHTTS